ncbi:MAG: hypothetical protein U9R73_00765 [Pseudomonadota bacterium]|nr:hypothetical protein [Pseudomonadota bacterium]
MSTAFSDVKPWPGQKAEPAQAGMGHNKPPLEEQVVIDFDEAIRTEGLAKRVDDLIASAGRAGECDSAEKAEKFGDLIRKGGVAAKAIEAEREKLNRPLLTAQRALKGKSDGYISRLDAAMKGARAKLNAYMVEQDRIAQEKRRLAEEQARKAAEAEQARIQAELDAQAAAGEGDTEFAEVAPLVEITPAVVEAPVIRTDEGTHVGLTAKWDHEIESVRKLPDSILKHEKVIEALNKVIGQQVRSGTRQIKGVRIFQTKSVSVR